MSNRVRHYMKDEVEAVIPLLHQTYMRIGRFQKNRSERNEGLLRESLDAIGPALQVFKPAIQRPKQPYFDAILIEDLDISDRIIALDTAVGAMHIEFSVPRMYMHQETEALRQALDECRMDAEEPGRPNLTDEDGAVLCRGLPAVPGIASGPVFVWKPGVADDEIPRRCVLVARMTRPEIVTCVDKIDAIVTEIGGRLCHAAILALEKNIPCVVGTGNALKVLRPGMPVTVDGSAGCVYPA